MKRILLILVLLCTTIANSQERTFEKEVSKISKRIERITKQQKDSLKQKVIAIDKRLEKGEITKTTAETLKKEVASYHARKIEKLVGEQERLLQLLVQDKTNGKIASSEENYKEKKDDYYDDDNTFTIGNKTFRFNISEGDKDENERRKKRRWKRKNKYQRSTTTQFVFAMGINNALTNNNLSSLDNSNYQIGRSRFYELGWTWKTRFTKRPSQLYFKYGVSFLWNNLRLKDNQIHVKNGNTTDIQVFPNQLSESRLRHVQMNFPLHLEWDLSKNRRYSDGRVRDRTNNSFRLGIGGFVGFKLGTRQYLEYRDVNNVEVEEIQFDNFNMNTFNYGVSGYLGYEDVSLYVKYDLNPLFQNTEVRNISIGLRLDLD
ncbi:hypothetical protein [Polaribacter porphyrae]|uniref:Outer membrane protein beta-barrel domain-containing protein n=1 Tax=Polaribacter porphyrae TaxID=1137780 RepID=A0A2S7WJP9_9FLAO|nr:hypothetical protein [Polaribacter porphyrae]PQJ77835.1 hypothetical protein BTO18_00935 [Polaribacter porphyrae]